MSCQSTPGHIRPLATSSMNSLSNYFLQGRLPGDPTGPGMKLGQF
ncbi:unnamed protein product, partial [Staurois parvus]